MRLAPHNVGIREVIAAAVDDIAAHLGEPVTIDGHCLRGLPRKQSATSGELAVPVNSDDAFVKIKTTDAIRLDLNRGMECEFRGAKYFIREFTADNFGWTSIELE